MFCSRKRIFTIVDLECLGRVCFLGGSLQEAGKKEQGRFQRLLGCGLCGTFTTSSTSQLCPAQPPTHPRWNLGTGPEPCRNLHRESLHSTDIYRCCLWESHQLTFFMGIPEENDIMLFATVVLLAVVHRRHKDHSNSHTPTIPGVPKDESAVGSCWQILTLALPCSSPCGTFEFDKLQRQSQKKRCSTSES